MEKKLIVAGTVLLSLLITGVSLAYTNEIQVTSKSIELNNIAYCESGGTHFNKNGQVIMNVNTNKSVDMGIYQINLGYWSKTAGRMELDLSKESDNRAFASWLYDEYGTQPWSASKHCWSKI